MYQMKGPTLSLLILGLVLLIGCKIPANSNSSVSLLTSEPHGPHAEIDAPVFRPSPTTPLSITSLSSDSSIVPPNNIPSHGVSQVISATTPSLSFTTLVASPTSQTLEVADAASNELTLTPSITNDNVSGSSADFLSDLTPAIWPTVTKQVLPDATAVTLVSCSEREVSDDLLILVTQQFSLPESYIPPDLVPLSSYFGNSVTLGQDTFVRAVIIDPLQQMIEAMHTAELRPSILSGYRSYGEQYLAWKWWNSQYPERAAIMSARAGQSEHQLGTTVDFGSPELDHLFHIDFANTSEGRWLQENAHSYGFAMSYPANTYEITGFKYEPWHFRYVGKDLSTQLHNSGQILTQWQLENLQPPCIP